MTEFQKKLPIEFDHAFMCHIKYRYSTESRLFIIPKKIKGASQIDKNETYWLPEEHAIVADKYMAYRDDYLHRNDFDWKPARDMLKAQARYGIECHKIETKKLKAINKTELLKFGITSEVFPSKDDDGITGEFEKRPREFWRFRQRWKKQFEDHVEWDDSTEVFIFHFGIHRLKPELKEFDWHIEERLNYQRKEAEDEKMTEKRRKNKSGSKKKVNKKATKKKK